MSKIKGKASPKKTPGEELCGKVEQVAEILGVNPEKIGLYKGLRGTYLEPSVDMVSILRGVCLALRAIYVQEMPKKKISDLYRLVDEIL